MATRVSLEYVLSKNGINLVGFLNKNKIKSYESLEEYCRKRNMLPISIEEYLKVFPPEDKKEIELGKNVKSKKAKSKNTSRKTSTTQKKRPTRSRSKKVTNT
jgi:hypothetical protein